MSFLNQFLDEELSRIQEKNQLRNLKIPNGIDFSSNDYLHISQNKFLIQKMKDSVDLQGLGSTASRLIRGHRESFLELEKKFSEFVNSEDSLFLANGFLANLGLIDCLADSRTYVLTDRLNHASILDGIRISGAIKKYYPHNDILSLEKILEGLPSESKKILVTESLFSMDGDFCKLKNILELKEKYSFVLILDEAHSLGVFGENGSGYANQIEHKDFLNRIDFRIFTAGKSLGLEGAFVSCSKKAKNYLINRMRTFIFSTAPMPAITSTLYHSIELVKSMNDERAKVKKFSLRLKNFLNSIGFDTGNSESHIIPVYLKEEKYALLAAQFLQEQGFDIRAIRPPTVKESRLRIIVNSGLEEKNLKDLETAFIKLKELLLNEDYDFGK